MKPRLFDSWAPQYDQWFETPIGSLVKQYESALLLEMLCPLPGETILDVGCGSGIFTLDVINQKVKITGVDMSEPMLRNAVKKIPAHSFAGVCADMCALPFADNSFDKAFSMTAIEFVIDAKQAVAELDRVTRKGGIVVLTTLNSLSPWAERRLAAAKNGHTLFQKIFFRSPDDMRELVPSDTVVKTAIHFCKDSSPVDVPEIERTGDEEHADTGAFLAVQWKVK